MFSSLCHLCLKKIQGKPSILDIWNCVCILAPDTDRSKPCTMLHIDICANRQFEFCVGWLGVLGLTLVCVETIRGKLTLLCCCCFFFLAGYRRLTLALTSCCCLSTAARRSWGRDCWKPSPMPKGLACSEPLLQTTLQTDSFSESPSNPALPFLYQTQSKRWQKTEQSYVSR